MAYNRVILKLSGEALNGGKQCMYDLETIVAVAKQVKQGVDAGVQLCVVIGGGNIWRGATKSDANVIDRTKSDQIGMLATIQNCIYTSEVFRSVGLKTVIMTPFAVGTMTEAFSKDAANAAMNEGKVVFFAGGTGHPYFSTDTGIVLKALEMDVDMILCAKNIDGVYDDDPRKNPAAKKYKTVSIDTVVATPLVALDLTASIMCQTNKKETLVFDLNRPNSIADAMSGINPEGTYVTVQSADCDEFYE